MIQKIKILHGDTARLELVNIPQTTGKLLQKVEHNGSVVRVSTPMRQDTQTGEYNILIVRYIYSYIIHRQSCKVYSNRYIYLNKSILILFFIFFLFKLFL